MSARPENLTAYEKKLWSAAEAIRDAREGTPGEDTPGYRAAVVALAALDGAHLTVLVEVSGGNVQDVYASGPVRVLLVDRDNIEAGDAVPQPDETYPVTDRDPLAYLEEVREEYADLRIDATMSHTDGE